MRRRIHVLLLALLACVAPAPKAAPPPIAASAPAPAPSPAPVRLESESLVAFPSGALTLHGFLYRPPGAGPFPAVVFNHGSEALPGDMRGQAAFYLPHGFVLFVPHRRGQGRSRDAGEYTVDHLSDHARVVNELATTQTDDVMSAVEYVRSLSYVDKARVAVTGCSYGGIVSLFAAERGTGVQAVVDFAGGAMSWAHVPELQDRMKQAARAARVPVFFVQAENDFDTRPSLVLSEEMRRAGKPVRVHVFPPNGSTHPEGHHFCAGGRSPAWGDEVLEFLNARP